MTAHGTSPCRCVRRRSAGRSPIAAQSREATGDTFARTPVLVPAQTRPNSAWMGHCRVDASCGARVP
jgi:hypothetical protein